VADFLLGWRDAKDQGKWDRTDRQIAEDIRTVFDAMTRNHGVYPCALGYEQQVCRPHSLLALVRCASFLAALLVLGNWFKSMLVSANGTTVASDRGQRGNFTSLRPLGRLATDMPPDGGRNLDGPRAWPRCILSDRR
jgi:hypothetical protein